MASLFYANNNKLMQNSLVNYAHSEEFSIFLIKSKINFHTTYE